MDERGYVAQALFDRLSGDGLRFRVLGDSHGYPERAPSEIQLAVAPAALAGVPRVVARFCHDLDLQLVHLAPEDSRAWRCVLAGSDEVGRPRFMSVRICSDYCRGLRRYLPITWITMDMIMQITISVLTNENETSICRWVAR